VQYVSAFPQERAGGTPKVGGFLPRVGAVSPGGRLTGACIFFAARLPQGTGHAALAGSRPVAYGRRPANFIATPDGGHMGLLTFSINVTLDGCVDHQEGIADDETHAFFTRLMDEGGAMLWGSGAVAMHYRRAP